MNESFTSLNKKTNTYTNNSINSHIITHIYIYKRILQSECPCIATSKCSHKRSEKPLPHRGSEISRPRLSKYSRTAGVPNLHVEFHGCELRRKKSR